MASDLISREGSIIALRRLAYQEIRGRAFVPRDAVERMLERQREAVDAVEVVRCKDCKHCAIDKYVKRPFCILNGEVKPNGHIWFGVGVSEEHYCSHGKRREEDA